MFSLLHNILEFKTLFFFLYSPNFPPKMSKRDDKRKFKKYVSNVVDMLTIRVKAYCVLKLSLSFLTYKYKLSLTWKRVNESNKKRKKIKGTFGLAKSTLLCIQIPQNMMPSNLNVWEYKYSNVWFNSESTKNLKNMTFL